MYLLYGLGRVGRVEDDLLEFVPSLPIIEIGEGSLSFLGTQFKS